jgi:hypothetical protein
MMAATVAVAQSPADGSNAQLLQEGFTVEAASIGAPAADGISGTITGTGGSSYRVRSIGGTWWMEQNADKPLTTGDGCANNSVDRGEYGHLYTWDCAASACPAGWVLPTDDDFFALSLSLVSNDKWTNWNSGSALAGSGGDGSYSHNEGRAGNWWSSSKSTNFLSLDKDKKEPYLRTETRYTMHDVRCKKVQ